MKAIGIKLAAVALALMLVASVAVSQSAAGPAGGEGFGFEHHLLNMMTDYLDLTDAQQAQVKQIMATEKPTIMPLVQQLHQTQQQIRQIEESGTFDEAKVRTLASQQAQIMTELIVEKAKIHSQIFNNILTPDQKAKAQKLMARHDARFQQHMQNQAPPQQ
jgi:periplasmic protein CpxP/Spy